ncbi:MAG: hypothetical protein GYB65_03625 [Chloroflexi bacterium]|nr:hypothetical protein [Chloroflexota bacterium]
MILVLLLAGCQSSDDAEHFAVYEVPVDGNTPQLLFEDSTKTYFSPIWSPDGTQIVVNVTDVGEKSGELHIFDVEHDTWRQLTDNGRNNWFPAWSPDGEHIVYISQREDDTATADIYMIRADGTGETILLDNDAFEYGLSWSPDGERLAYGSEQGGAWQIYIMTISTGETAPLATPQHGNSPTWSPDGAWLAFTSDRDGDDDIFVSRIDGSAVQNLTANEDWDDNPRWSPDGTSIAFTSYRNDQYGIYLINPDTGIETNITPDTSLYTGFAAWYPDGSRVLFQGGED